MAPINVKYGDSQAPSPAAGARTISAQTGAGDADGRWLAMIRDLIALSTEDADDESRDLQSTEPHLSQNGSNHG